MNVVLEIGIHLPPFGTALNRLFQRPRYNALSFDEPRSGCGRIVSNPEI